ncbi:MAG TPA: protein-L-isoaspartate(D-aspartate) O-methyltransferase [Thermoanaerobaculia bacterium]
MNGRRPVSGEQMIQEQLVSRGIADSRVLEAFHSVPRELFVPPTIRDAAFEDNPLPLSCGQTISQPFIVAYMTQALRLQGDEKVLEIGTGSGYQTAILAKLVRLVYSAELESDLAGEVPARLAALDINNVVLGVGNGLTVFADQAPFDAILSAAAPVSLPEELVEQLAEGGRCILPIGGSDLQYLWLIERSGGRVVKTRLEPVRFVPLR